MTKRLAVAEIVEHSCRVLEEEGLILFAQVCFGEDGVEVGEEERRLTFLLVRFGVRNGDDGEEEVDDGLGFMGGLILGEYMARL